MKMKVSYAWLVALFVLCLSTHANATTYNGSLTGNFDVSPTGAASYSIPIEVPPGINGLQPGISLNYNSQGGNGLLGVGWSLGGLSSITRCGKTIEQNGEVAGVKFDSSDRFCLDGQQLFAVSGAYGASGTEYRTEIESYSRVISYGTYNNAPQYFEVIDKSGRIFEYGGMPIAIKNQSNGQVYSYVWPVTKISDRFGNQIIYNYTQNRDEGYYHVSQIDYAEGNTSLIFDYENRSDIFTGFTAGAKISTPFRLKGIRVQHNLSEIRAYTVSYVNSYSTNRSLIQSIAECAYGVCKDPVKIKWESVENTSLPSFETPQLKINAGAAGGANPYGFEGRHESYADVNGDGRQDKLWVPSGRHDLYVALASDNGFSTPKIWLAAGSADGANPYGYNSWHEHYGDVNGDGLADKIWVPYGRQERYVALSTGTSFSTPTIWLGEDPSTYSKPYGFEGRHEAAIDINGDGLVDFAWVPSGRHDLYVALSMGNGFSTPTIWIAAGAADGANPYGYIGRHEQYVDVNGDGLLDKLWVPYQRHDLYVALGNGNGFLAPQIWLAAGSADGANPYGYNGWHEHYGDVNGDGLADKIWVPYGRQERYVALSTGTSFSTPTIWLGEYPSTYSKPYGFEGRHEAAIDVNGDGLVDFAWVPSGRHDLYVALSTGNGFSTPKIWISAGSAGGGNPYAYNSWHEGYPDINGDGLPDKAWVPYEKHDLYVSHGSAGRDQVISIESGSSVRTDIQYTTITDDAVYTKYNTQTYPYSIRDYQGSMYVASNYSISNGIGGQNTYSYHYEGAKINVKGRGFLGFAKTSITNQQSNTTVNTYYRQQTMPSDYWANGLVNKTETIVNGKLVGKNVNTWLSINSDKGRPYPYLSQSISTAYEPASGGKISEDTTNNYNINLYGIVGRSVTTLLDGSFTTQENTPCAADTANWIFNICTSMVSSTPSSLVAGSYALPVTDRTDFTYYPGTGALWTKTSQVGTNVERTETFTYNNYGNQNSHKIEGRDGTATGNIVARTTSTSYSYTPTQLTITTTNPLLQTSSMVIDRATGNTVSQVGINGITTSWQYDAFARKIRENRADGTYTQWEYLSCDPGVYCGQYDKFYVKSSGSGKPIKMVHYDTLGRQTSSHVQNVDGEYVHQYKVYDNLGRVTKESRNEFDGPVIYWKQYIYDSYGRLSKMLLPGNTNVANPDEVMIYYPFVSGQGVKTATTRYRKGNNGTTALTSVQYKSSSGKLLQSIDSNNNANRYYYDGFGRLMETVDPYQNRVTYQYNAQGNKIGVDDPNLGAWSYRYDSLGLLRSQTDAKNQTITMSYDTLNRLKTRSETTGGTTTWYYDTAAGAGKGKLHKMVRGSDNYQEIYAYDNLGRASSVTTKLDGVDYVVTNQYDNLSRLQYVTYPASGSSGRFKTQNVYSATGFLTDVKEVGSGYTFWSRVSTNANGNVTWEALGNGLSTVREFHPISGALASITTGASAQIQYLEYDFDNLGNLEARYDYNQKWLGQTGVTETFTYDALNRLTNATINGTTAKSYQYDAVGNIQYSSDLGSYIYGQNGAGPHAVTYVQGASLSYDANGNMINGRGRVVNYTSYNKPSLITQGTNSTAFTYGPNRNLYKQVAVTSQGTTTSRYVGKLFEQVNKPGGTIEYRNNVYAGSKLVAVHTRKSNAATTLRYFHTDHLGSISVITKENGQIAERFSYDPFGKRRDAQWNDGYVALMTSGITGLAYTKHKSLDNVGLIHMGGRVYDPELARFLSADPRVAYPASTQGWNRYSYTDNNPLSRVDPSGYSWLSKKWKSLSNDVKTVVATVVQAIDPITGSAMMAQTKDGRNILAVQAGVATCAMSAGALCAKGIAMSYGMYKANRAYSNGASIEDSLKYGAAHGLRAYSILSPVMGGYANAVSMYARTQSAAWAAASVASSIVDYRLNSYFSNKLAKEVARHGVSMTELNIGLLAISGMGNAMLGSRFNATEGHMGGFCTRAAYCGSFIFDVADVALAYQGLPNASSLHYMFTSWGTPLTGHSLGALDASNLVASGAAPYAEVHSLPFGAGATLNVDVTNKAFDPVNGGFLGSIFNLHANVIPGGNHFDDTYPMYGI